MTPDEVNALLPDWPPAIERTWGPFTYGVSGAGFGRWLRVGRRVSFNSPGATTRMWPRLVFGADENCNRAVTLVVWPLGHVDIWWEPRWWTVPCADCQYIERWT